MSLVVLRGGASPLEARPPTRDGAHVLLRSSRLPRRGRCCVLARRRGIALQRPQAREARRSSESSAKPEVVLEGQDISSRRPLPFPVGLTGLHAGAEPPGNVVARFFPERLMMILDLDTQRPMEPLALRLLKAGKSRAVYDLVPPRGFVYKVSLEGGHGLEAEIARSLPLITPETLSYPKLMLKLY